MYVQASLCALDKNKEENAFRVYVTSALQNINEILAQTLTGRYMTMSYDDMIHPKPAEERTGEEIIDHMKEKLRNL